MRSLFKIEVCANSVESALAAQRGGADRVELCASMPEGGTTPSYGCIRQAKSLLDIGLNVIVRPRGGDFVYSDLEAEIVGKDIEMCRQLGVDAVVLGALTEDGNIDVARMKYWMEAAGNMSVTFHRAFDCCRDPFVGMEELIELGVDRILTSGQQSTAEKGIPLLKQLEEENRGRIALLAGCGVNENNIRRIYEETRIREYHFSARVSRPGRMKIKNAHVNMGKDGMNESLIEVSSEARIRETIHRLTASV